MDQLRSRWARGGIAVLASCLVLPAPALRSDDAPHDDERTVTGTVVDASGRGIPNVSVYVETDPCCLLEEHGSRTDPTGAFEILGVLPGLVRVRAVHPSYSVGGVAELAVDSDTDPLPVLIELHRGVRVAGRVHRRDGRPFTAGWVIVTSSHPDAAHGFPQPVALDGEGAFAADHLQPGRGQVYVLALTPHAAPRFAGDVPTLSPIAIEPVDLREGEEAVADITLSDVVVSGRVTRGGEPAADIRVTVSTGPRRSLSIPGLPVPPPGAGPAGLEATTAGDGSYELLVFGPGPALVTLTALASGQAFPARTVTVPDTAGLDLDFEIPVAVVSGIVLDRGTGAPLPDVSLRLSRIDGDGQTGVPGWSGLDGGFAIGAEAGDYLLSAERPGRVRVVRRLSVGSDGLTDVRIEMGRGLSIVGRVIDPAGRPVRRQVVLATGADGFERGAVRDDGSFRIEGLGPGPYALSVGSTLAGFATRRAVRPGPQEVRLTLRPAGKVVLRVVSDDGQPVAGAVPSIISVDGAPIGLRGWSAPPTNEEGLTEVGSPPGEVGFGVRAPSGVGGGTIDVPAGEAVSLEIVMLPPEGPGH